MGKTKDTMALANRREERLRKKLAKVQKKNEKKAASERESRKKNKEKHNSRKGAEKKLKKRKKKNHDTETSAETTDTTSAPTPASDKASGPGWNNWSDAQFESEERKSKFLRFMGIKSPTEKVAADEAATTSAGQPAKRFDSAISKEYQAKVQHDLEKQFSAGVAMRQQTQRGARGGLGF